MAAAGTVDGGATLRVASGSHEAVVRRWRKKGKGELSQNLSIIKRSVSNWILSDLLYMEYEMSKKGRGLLLEIYAICRYR